MHGICKIGGEHMTQQNLTLHETMEIHELLNFKTICMTASKLIQGVVFDQDLKALLGKDVQQSMQAVNVLRAFKQNSTTIIGGENTDGL
jgi:similar to spore coat protein